MSTKILECTCEHEYQDERHGDRRRVHNECVKDNRCWIHEWTRLKGIGPASVVKAKMSLGNAPSMVPF